MAIIHLVSNIRKNSKYFSIEMVIVATALQGLNCQMRFTHTFEWDTRSQSEWFSQNETLSWLTLWWWACYTTKHEACIHCCWSVGPASQTVAQRSSSIGTTPRTGWVTSPTTNAAKTVPPSESQLVRHLLKLRLVGFAVSRQFARVQSSSDSAQFMDWSRANACAESHIACRP